MNRSFAIGTAALALALNAAMGFAQAHAQTAPDRDTTLSVQRALQRLPYYGVFDFLAYRVENGTVTLVGSAYRESLRREAEAAVRRVPGVRDIANEIEVLPASQLDEAIRWRTFAAIYGDGQLSRYLSGGDNQVQYDFDLLARFPNMQPVGMYPVHILVKHLRMTLVGMLDNDIDKSVALARARQVPGVLKVDDEIGVRTSRKRS